MSKIMRVWNWWFYHTLFKKRLWACTQETSEPLHNYRSICFSLSVHLQMIYKIKHPVKWQLNPSVSVCWVNILWWMCENLITVEQGTKRLNELELEYISHILNLCYPWINVLFQFLTAYQPAQKTLCSAPVCINMTLECCPFATLPVNDEPDPCCSAHQASDWTAQSLWLLHQAWHHQYVPWHCISGLNLWCGGIIWRATNGTWK